MSTPRAPPPSAPPRAPNFDATSSMLREKCQILENKFRQCKSELEITKQKNRLLREQMNTMKDKSGDIEQIYEQAMEHKKRMAEVREQYEATNDKLALLTQVIYHTTFLHI